MIDYEKYDTYEVIYSSDQDWISLWYKIQNQLYQPYSLDFNYPFVKAVFIRDVRISKLINAVNGVYQDAQSTGIGCSWGKVSDYSISLCRNIVIDMEL